MEHQKAIRERLNQERAAQIADKEMRKAKALARQKQEEKEVPTSLPWLNRVVRASSRRRRCAESAWVVCLSVWRPSCSA